MRTLSSIMVAITALMSACTNAPGTTSTAGLPDKTLEAGSFGGDGSGSGSGSCTSPACPLGADTFTSVLGASNPSQLMDLAAEPGGNVLVGAANPTTSPGISGVTELSPAGAVLTSLPFGSLVATDAAGDKYIAGALSGPIDIGHGVVLRPTGNVDVFIIKLDAGGRVVLARVLDLCGAGLVSLAVASDGRIALSGTEFGTVVLSATGDVLHQVPEFGQVAFDSTGDLLLAASSQPGAFPFLERLDPSGKQVFRTTFEGQGVQLTGIVIDAQDNIVFTGFTTAFVAIPGLDITAKFAPESGRVTGAFVAKVAPSFAHLLALDLGIVEANAVAVDSAGQIFVGGAVTVNTGFFRSPVIVKIDASGHATTFNFGGEGGRVLALAVDACGSVIAGLVRQQSPDPTSPIEAVVQKLSL